MSSKCWVKSFGDTSAGIPVWNIRMSTKQWLESISNEHVISKTTTEKAVQIEKLLGPTAILQNSNHSIRLKPQKRDARMSQQILACIKNSATNQTTTTEQPSTGINTFEITQHQTLQIQIIVTTLRPIMETTPLQMNQLLMKHQPSRTDKIPQQSKGANHKIWQHSKRVKPETSVQVSTNSHMLPKDPDMAELWNQAWTQI